MLNIERTSQEIIIRLPLDLEIGDIQNMSDFLTYKHSIQQSKAKKDGVSELAASAKKGWWEKNKDRFPGLSD